MLSADPCPDRLWLVYQLLLRWGLELLAKRDGAKPKESGDTDQLAGEAASPDVAALESSPCPL